MPILTKHPNRNLWDGFLKADPDEETLPSRPRFDGKRILITGAGGCIGSAVAEAMADQGAQSICLLDSAEHGLDCLQRLCERRGAVMVPFVPVVGSVEDDALLAELFSTHHPQIVIHAAAMKYVTLMESNALAAARTNIVGTARVLAAAANAGVERWILLSTDKAVEPIGIMGATKAVAERLVLTSPDPGRCVIRLCNVLGTSGSVAPLFVEQIERGDPVTVTDARATRLFITLKEAVSCIFESASHASDARLFAPRRAESRRIEELAQYLVRRSAASSSRIVHIGLRRGERLHEALWSSAENALSSELSARLWAISCPNQDVEAVDSMLASIAEAVRLRDCDRLRETLAPVFANAGEEVNA